MKRNKVFKMVLMAVLLAIVIVLQFFANVIKIGEYSFSLVLVPIVVGAIILGAFSGAVLGFTFGLITLIASITGLDVGGNVMFNFSPVATTFICLLKGTLAGLVPGLIFKALDKKNHIVAIIVASASAPIANTGTFVIFAFVFFYDLLVSWANGSNVIAFVFLTLISINFIIELTVNVVLSPAIATVVRIFKERYKLSDHYDTEV